MQQARTTLTMATSSLRARSWYRTSGALAIFASLQCCPLTSPVYRAIAHDPELYHDATEFKPERFLGVNGRTPEYDPHLLSFGFGRRICPGQHLAAANLYLAIARSLAVFDITHRVKNGKEVPVTPEFTTGIISHPAPFELSIRVRSPEHEKLIRAVEKSYPWEKSHAEELQLKI
ncbi:unnamed protein product [Aspergillus oryzae var. brunneus]|uniref:Unnamed protein product n=1 Tax=Aspergillus oryzae var. brunneus TaxID=332754 RepID=A0ABQ6L7B2_ASPOZ|nr:unnamed protein product [Aspergillus oryzae]GMG53921.1 unnamed protein product [Aspergillus oryzae var. brunneus]